MNPPFDFKNVGALLQKYRYALLVLLVGAALLAWPGEKSAVSPNPTPAAAVEGDSFDLAGLEQRMASSLSAIEGVGRAEVVLTLQAGSRTILAEDTDLQQNAARRSTLILSAGSGAETTVTTQVICPVFQGALVVCDGGGKAEVRLEVVRAVEALTGLRADRISVSQRNGESP